MLSSSILSFFFATSVSVLAKPLNVRRTTSYLNPEPCTGNCTGVHDPTLIKTESGKWFRLSTNGNIAIASADDVTGPWTYQGAMLPDGSVIQVVDNQEIWVQGFKLPSHPSSFANDNMQAPDVSFIGDTYYAYYCVSVGGYQGSDIGVATSPSLEVGSWTDHGSIGIPLSSDYNRIDPNWFRESVDSTVYFNFGSAWGDIYQTDLDSTFLTVASDADTPTNLIYNSTVPSDQDYAAISEGSFLFWWNVASSKYYYMFFSSGACCNAEDSLAPAGDEYKIMVCRSESATGPFVDQDGNNCLTDNGGTLVLGSHDDVYAPGGQGVYYDSNVGRPIVYYHYGMCLQATIILNPC